MIVQDILVSSLKRNAVVFGLFLVEMLGQRKIAS